MAARRALLLVASPHGRRSTSHALGASLLAGAAQRGMAVETRFLYPEFAVDPALDGLLDALAVDLLLLAFPLYVDQLPAPLVCLLERMAQRRRAGAPMPAALAAIVNCGFPETRQCEPAAAIVELFCARNGIRSAGCLQLGMGGFVAGRSPEKCGPMLRRQRRALALAAQALAAGEAVPDAALRAFARPLMPRWLYAAAANLGFRRAARRHGVSRELRGQPCPR